MNTLLKYLMIPVAAAGFTIAGCSGSEYQNHDSDVALGNFVAQNSGEFIEDGQVKIGIVSAIEGALDNARNSAAKLRGVEGLDAVIVAGDCYENEDIRRNPSYPGSTDNVNEMIDGIKPYAELGVPVFVIAGNHEVQSVYNEAIGRLREEFPNVFDINDETVDLEGLNLVGMGGYHHPRFTDVNGFLLNGNDYERAFSDLKELQSQNEPTVLVTHGPPKASGSSRIDLVRGAGHVGDESTREIMQSPDLSDVTNVHGHIHEGGRNSFGYRAGKSHNVAAVTSFMNRRGPNTSLLTIEDGQVVVDGF